MKPSQGWRAKMIKVTVSKEARKDLVNIHRYLSEELEPPPKQQRELFMNSAQPLKICSYFLAEEGLLMP